MHLSANYTFRNKSDYLPYFLFCTCSHAILVYLAFAFLGVADHWLVNILPFYRFNCNLFFEIKIRECTEKVLGCACLIVF